jgi:Amt family ammonium transporter
VNAGDTAWVMVSAALVLFMTVGLAFFYGGLEPRRNVLNMVAMNLFTIAIVTDTWVAVGFSLAFGPDAGHGLIGNLHYAGLANMGGLWPGTHIPKLDFMAFQMMFAIITPALITCGLGIIIRASIGLRPASKQEEFGLSAMFQDTGSAVPL